MTRKAIILKLNCSFPKRPLFPGPFMIKFLVGKGMLSLTKSLNDPFVCNISGQYAADFHSGIIKVPLAFSHSSFLIQFNMSRGGGTIQFTSPDHSWSRPLIPSVPGTQYLELNLLHLY